MTTPDDPVQIYQELSTCYEQRNEPPMRDRFLVLAADAALRAGRVADADRFRLRLLKLNPHHLLKPYASFNQAMQAPDVQTYIRDLRLNYPPEVAAVLLNSLRAADSTMSGAASQSMPKPTQPDDDATVALGEPAESLKVYRDQHESDLAETAALPKELVEMARRAEMSQPPLSGPQTPPPAKNTPRPQAAPAVLPKKKVLAAPRPEPLAITATSAPQPASETEAANGGGWFAAVLFVIVLAAGLTLAAYTFARPFLQ